ncbi:hypothetical protein F5144DRAFT_574129 [Chaetomium tenue]|uniref:Uncharacterized protein n=1 Tax=Chaetomium tenue TaxID=1854479 RepID=A0ACB7PAJ4_9PEZI|nr:hypothetical protein F5144DRAFT_574129 [Chaetomium globosum]
MQGDVTEDGLRQSIAAFAVSSVSCLIHIIYTRKSSLRLDWYILTISWLVFGIAGSCLAVLTARTRDVRLHLCLKGDAFLSAEILLIIAVGRPFVRLYQGLRVILPWWLHIPAAVGTVSYPLSLGLGLWILIYGKNEVIWAAPCVLSLVFFFFLGSLFLWWRHDKWKALGWWGFTLLAANLVAFVLAVVGASLRSDWLLLSQCLSRVVVVLLYDGRQWWTSLNGQEVWMYLSIRAGDRVWPKLRSLTGDMRTREGGSDAEDSLELGYGMDQAGVRKPRRVHMQEERVGTANWV